jgi:hypothetical protein
MLTKRPILSAALMRRPSQRERLTEQRFDCFEGTPRSPPIKLSI